MAPSYNYDTAKRALNETDKDRFLCCYLNITDPHAVNIPLLLFIVLYHILTRHAGQLGESRGRFR